MFHQFQTPAPAVVAAGLLAADPLDPLIDMVAPALDGRIALVNPGALDLACTMLRRGYQTVSVIGLDGRMPAHQFDVVIIPRHASPTIIERALFLAHRMLAAMGAVALRLPADHTDMHLTWARQQLLVNGFTAVRVQTAGGETLIGAELPFHDGLPRAGLAGSASNPGGYQRSSTHGVGFCRASP